MTRERINTGVWTTRAIARWCLCVIGGTLAAASCASVIGPQMGWHGKKHGIGGTIAELLPKGARANVSPHLIHWVVARSPEGFVDVDDARADKGREAILHACGGGDDVWKCMYYEYKAPVGLWGPTSWKHIATIEVFVESNTQHATAYGNLSTSELEAVRSAALDGIETQWPLEWPQSRADLIAHGAWTGTEPFALGWILNVCTGVGLALFAWTAPGVVRDTRRHKRMLAYLRDHRCGSCGYDVRGLAEGTTVCPECGVGVPPSPREDAGPSPSRWEGAESARPVG